MKCTYQWCDENPQQQRDNVRPSRESNVLLNNDNETKNKAEYKDGNIPPPRRLLVVLGHVGVVAIVISAASGALVRPYNISTPEQETVSDEGSDL